MGSSPPLLSSVSVTSAMLSRAFLSEPEKITSLVFFERSMAKLCSPRHQRTASTTLLLPLPLGPTTAVIPGSKRNSVRRAKVLKP
jgi:hypothetical protein